MKTLKIAKGLTLPVDAVTQTLAILARKGSGKSFTARRLGEQLFKAGLQVVGVDPKGDWWGMRSSADGKGPGLGFLILGGEHGDLPLEPGSGELVAKLVVEERVSVILDLSLFRKHEVATFATAFLENLYRLKAREAYRTPVMLLVDEADAVAPQKPQRGEERMLGAIEDIVRRGRQRGIGCTLVTQRSAVLNKNVLTQAQVMVAMRTIAPQDLAAMDAWIDVHGTVEQRAELMKSLPSLPRGDAWVWSPGWPTDDGIFQRVHVAPIETFDSGATPKPGEKRVEPKQRADVDLASLRRQMAATVERAQANDPASLRRRIAELERELAKKPAAAPPAKVERVQVPVLKDSQVKRLEVSIGRAEKVEERLRGLSQSLNAEANSVQLGAQALRELVRARLGASPPAAPRPGAPLRLNREAFLRPETGTVSPARRPTPAPAPPRAAPAEDGALTKPERGVLIAVAQHHHGVTRVQLSVLLGHKRSYRDLLIQKVSRRGFIEARGERIMVTEAGVAELGNDYEPLPTGAELLAHWRTRLPAGELAAFEVAVAAYPEAVSRDQVSEATGQKRSYRDLCIQKLARRELLTDAGRGQVRAAEVLFT